MPMYRKLTTAAAVAVLTLGLAACGGGGSDEPTASAPPPPAMPDPTPPAPVAVTLPSDGNDYLSDDEKALPDGTISVTAGGSMDVGPYTLSCSDAGPCMVTIADGAVTATGEVTAAYSTAAMTAIADAKMVAMDENSGRSLGMHSALTDATGTRGQAILAGAKDDDLEIMRGMSGGAMVTDGQLGGKSGWTTGTADSAISGFEGHKLTRKTEKFVVHTDIAAAKHKAFLTHYVGATSATIGTVTVTAVTTTTDPNYGQIALPAATIVAAGNAGLLDPTKFPQPKDEGKGDNTYTYDDGEGPGKKSSSFKGTFHGAPGTYDCPTTPCVVQVSDRSTSSEPEYHATATTGDWTFTPDVDNNPQIVLQDADHMHFGWWVKTPTAAAAEGQYLYDAEMFYGGSAMFPEANIVALDGDADYSGPAAGLFAVTGDNAAHGEFTATATLTAKFGVATAGTDPGTISGKVASFVRDDGVANDWSVTLASTAITATGGNTAAAAGTTNSRVTGGSNDNIGAWEFQMYGSGRNNADPTGIAGSFRAAIDANTAVAGAFATKPN